MGSLCNSHTCPGCGTEFSHVLAPGDQCHDLKKTLRRCPTCYYIAQHAPLFDSKSNLDSNQRALPLGKGD